MALIEEGSLTFYSLCFFHYVLFKDARQAKAVAGVFLRNLDNIF